jgi:signal transduction histidine kinase
VQGLLQLAHADTLAKRPEDRLDLSSLVEDRVGRAHAHAEDKGVVLDATVAPGVTISAQAPPIAEVVDNLLSNAVKYTPPGGRVDLRLTHHSGAHRNGEARLMVSDTGVGFVAEEADRLFDRFYRSDDATVQAEPGSGLGLSIVRTIVEGYDGEVVAHSAGPERGSTFEVRLPCVAHPPDREGRTDQS